MVRGLLEAIATRSRGDATRLGWPMRVTSGSRRQVLKKRQEVSLLPPSDIGQIIGEHPPLADVTERPVPLAAARRSWTRWAGAAISLLTLGMVAWYGVRQGTPRLPDSRGEMLLVTVAATIALGNTVLRGWRWHSIMTKVGLPHSRIDAVGLTFVGYMGNTVLPARGGDVLRIALAKTTWGTSIRAVTGTLIAERLLDVLAVICLFAAVTGLRVGGAPLGDVPAMAAVAAVLAALAVLLCLRRLRRANRLHRFAELIRPFARASRALVGRRGAVLFAVTFVIWVLDGLIFFVVGTALDAGISPLEALFLVALAGFSGLVPALPGYAGTFDGATMLGARALGVPGTAAVGFVLLVRFVIFVPITIVGAVVLAARHGGFRTPRGDQQPRPVIDD